MNWEAIGAIGEVLGAGAVVITLVYLAKQISLSHGMAKATGARELQVHYADLYALIATNSEIRELVTRLRDPNYVAQSPEEEEQIESFVLLLGGVWLNIAIAYEQGQIDLTQYQIYREDVRVKFAKWPGLLPYFKDLANKYPASQSFEILSALYE